MPKTESGAPTEENPEDIPQPLQEKLASFDNEFSKVRDALQPLLSIPLSELHAKLPLIDKAKLDLISVYAVNSLFWMYLNLQGISPKDHPIKQELDRIRKYMVRVKDAADKQTKVRDRVNTEAAKRVLRSALWEPKKKKKISTQSQSSTPQKETSETTTSPSSPDATDKLNVGVRDQPKGTHIRFASNDSSEEDEEEESRKDDEEEESRKATSKSVSKVEKQQRANKQQHQGRSQKNKPSR